MTDALSASPTDMGALYLLSQAQRRLGDLTSAAVTAQKIITQDSTSPWGYYALAETLEQRGLHKELVDALEPAVARFRAQGSRGSDDLQMLLPYLGFAYQDGGQYDKAIAAFEEARKLDPGDPSLLDYLIQANTSAKRYSTALDLVHGAMAKNPDDLHLARLEAKALVDSGKVDDGVNVIQGLVTKNPDDPMGYLTLAEIYQDAKRNTQAVTVLEQARRRFPKDASIPFQLGAVLDKEKKFDEAEAAFREVIALDPDHAPALNYLGYMLADRGIKPGRIARLPEARRGARSVQRRLPGQPGLGVLQVRRRGPRRDGPLTSRRAARDQFRHPGSLRRRARPPRALLGRHRRVDARARRRRRLDRSQGHREEDPTARQKLDRKK